MTSIRVILVAVVALVVMVLTCVDPAACEDAAPAGRQIEYESEYDDRYRIYICSLTMVYTPYGPLNDAACSGHCRDTEVGYTGGRCINGVCKCRQ